MSSETLMLQQAAWDAISSAELAQILLNSGFRPWGGLDKLSESQLIALHKKADASYARHLAETASDQAYHQWVVHSEKRKTVRVALARNEHISSDTAGKLADSAARAGGVHEWELNEALADSCRTWQDVVQRWQKAPKLLQGALSHSGVGRSRSATLIKLAILSGELDPAVIWPLGDATSIFRAAWSEMCRDDAGDSDEIAQMARAHLDSVGNAAAETISHNLRWMVDRRQSINVRTVIAVAAVLGDRTLAKSAWETRGLRDEKACVSTLLDMYHADSHEDRGRFWSPILLDWHADAELLAAALDRPSTCARKARCADIADDLAAQALERENIGGEILQLARHSRAADWLGYDLVMKLLLRASDEQLLAIVQTAGLADERGWLLQSTVCDEYSWLLPRLARIADGLPAANRVTIASVMLEQGVDMPESWAQSALGDLVAESCANGLSAPRASELGRLAGNCGGYGPANIAALVSLLTGEDGSEASRDSVSKANARQLLHDAFAELDAEQRMALMEAMAAIGPNRSVVTSVRNSESEAVGAMRMADNQELPRVAAAALSGEMRVRTLVQWLSVEESSERVNLALEGLEGINSFLGERKCATAAMRCMLALTGEDSGEKLRLAMGMLPGWTGSLRELSWAIDEMG